MNILKKDDVLSLCDGHRVDGLVLMGSYAEQPTKNNSTYLGGQLNALGSIPFKVWQGNCFNTMNSTDFSGKICNISGSVNEYNGTKSLILKDITEIPQSQLITWGISEMDFFEPKYDVEKMYNIFYTTVQKNVSENALKVLDIFMSEVKDKLTKEFAAISHHDNCFGGLIAHKTKVLKASLLVKNYPNILQRATPDLLFLGCALHDIGKVVEYSNGVISDVGKKISHLTIGCLMVNSHKDEIVELMGEDFFYSLLSVIAQHHGEYGDAPRTVAAYVIHQFDCLDSTLTSLDEVLSEVEDNQQIKFDGSKLI